MIVFVRHAERGDNEFPKILSDIPYDPPITKDSKDTILKSSIELSEIFRTHGVHTVKVMSSKFLRCLMTAEQLVSHFRLQGFKIKEPFVIQGQISEYLRTDWFTEYPLNNLIYDSDKIRQYIPKQSLWAQRKLQKHLNFPQNYVMFHKRIGKFKSRLRYPQNGECLLVVTHGFVVRQMCWRMNQIPNIVSQIKYCGYAVFSYDGKQQILLKSKL